ncbi:Choline-sulfatase [Roseimaritima multifibrata]|uniref:Choline-sulfatase n=1 Tax=Roseimaritima multifibrata TaxID=1930274 RepID=A0A517MML4_9BACT|nr:sulfatase [Roseimaritima multifibrata]QDS96128.1 Choline-sulfatase [Roseimaritima multifibrata]
MSQFNRHLFAKQALLTLVLVLIPSLARGATDSPPNVLLIITDEHNFRTLGCYRERMPREQAEMWGPDVVVPTPHLDRIAKEGVICTRAYATSPVCSPCRAAMITGRYPHNTGVPQNDLVLDRSIPTLADRLNDAGYRTGFFGKWHLGGKGKPEWEPKVDGGFQFKKYMFNRGHWKKLVIENGKALVGARKNGEPSYSVDGADQTTFATDWLTDRAIDYVTDKTQHDPFLAVISYPDPHGPNSVRAPYDHRFDDLRFAAPRTFQTGIPSPKWLGGKGKHEIFRGKDMSKYFGMVQCIDDNVGKLLERMDEANLLENTLVIMTSDHGDLCYEHDRLNKGNPYEGSARVPMLIRFPRRIAAGKVYTQPVGTVDLTPTVMGLLGRDGNAADQGRDLSAELAGNSNSPIDPANPPITFLRSSGIKTNWVAAIDDRYKLVLSTSDVPWLFDAKLDPDELLNFFRRPGTEGVAERLGKALQEYGTKTNDPAFVDPTIAASLKQVLGAKK